MVGGHCVEPLDFGHGQSAPEREGLQICCLSHVLCKGGTANMAVQTLALNYLPPAVLVGLLE